MFAAEFLPHGQLLQRLPAALLAVGPDRRRGQRRLVRVPFQVPAQADQVRGQLAQPALVRFFRTRLEVGRLTVGEQRLQIFFQKGLVMETAVPAAASVRAEERDVLARVAPDHAVELCQCCGRFFIPKTKKKTLYCDRVIKDGKTCKELGPRLKHKRAAMNQKVIEEFDRARQRMYKRYERAKDVNQTPSERDLSLSEFYEWLEPATRARDLFLAGEMSEEEALKIINVP